MGLDCHLATINLQTGEVSVCAGSAWQGLWGGGGGRGSGSQGPKMPLGLAYRRTSLPRVGGIGRSGRWVVVDSRAEAAGCELALLAVGLLAVRSHPRQCGTPHLHDLPTSGVAPRALHLRKSGRDQCGSAGVESA